MTNPQRTKRPRPDANGFTLLEIVISLAVLTLIIVASAVVIMSATRQNRIMAMQSIAGEWMQLKAEEVQAIARDNARRGKVGAQAVLFHYGAGGSGRMDSSSPEDTLPLGPKGAPLPKSSLDAAGRRLVCLFTLPVPGGESGLSGGMDAGLAGAQAPDLRAVGKLVFYLDETLVPAGNSQGVVWRDRGVSGTMKPAGFDMNRDGEITPRDSMPAPAEFREPRRFGILQLPVDIIVTYYEDETHERVLFERVRRIVITGNRFDKTL